jgi:hypothetical protein
MTVRSLIGGASAENSHHIRTTTCKKAQILKTQHFPQSKSESHTTPKHANSCAHKVYHALLQRIDPHTLVLGTEKVGYR